MKTFSKEELKINMETVASKIDKGAVFIHPTDTIYGLGCDATDKTAVQKIRDLKKRPPNTAMSIIAPSKEWIHENCEVTKEAEEWIDKLPGPYTLVLKLKNKDAIAENVAPGFNSVGVRIPDHWIKDLVSALNKPIITTSANISGRVFMTNIDNLNSEIKKGVSFVIYEGEKIGKPSKIIRLEGEKVEINER